MRIGDEPPSINDEPRARAPLLGRHPPRRLPVPGQPAHENAHQRAQRHLLEEPRGVHGHRRCGSGRRRGRVVFVGSYTHVSSSRDRTTYFDMRVKRSGAFATGITYRGREGSNCTSTRTPTAWRWIRTGSTRPLNIRMGLLSSMRCGTKTAKVGCQNRAHPFSILTAAFTRNRRRLMAIRRCHLLPGALRRIPV